MPPEEKVPDDAAGVLVRIRALLPALAPAERRVGEAVVADPALVTRQTIGALAAAVGTSEATVTRFCKTVGLPGYPHLRIALAADSGRAQGSSARAVPGDIGPDEDIRTVIDKIAFADARAIEDTAAQLDAAVLAQVVTALDAAGRVDVYGVGASAFVGLDLQQKLHRIGRAAFAWSDAHIMLTSAAVLSPGDVALGISHSGTTVEVMDALAQARERGATTVALTNFPRSPLARAADLVLTTAARETTFRSGATASRLAQLLVVDCVFVGLATRSFERTREALDVTYRAVHERPSRHRKARP